MSAITERSPAASPSSVALLVGFGRARRAVRGGLAAVLVAAAAVGAAGCTSAAPSTSTTAAEHRGAARALTAALDDIDLDAKQRTDAEAVINDAHARIEPVRAAHRQIAATLADRIAAGTLAPGDVDGAIAALIRSEQAAVPVIQDAANRLHGMLDADQREDLLDGLRSSWRGRRHGEGGPKARLKRLAEELELTDAQRDQIRDAVKVELKRTMPALRAKMESTHDQLKAAAEAFESDKFDARSFDLNKDGIEVQKGFIEAALRVVQASLPALTPAQRAKLAEHVREHVATME